MTTSTISLTLDTKFAAQYETASAEDKRKIQLLVTIYLKSIVVEASFIETMNDISSIAQANGLTSEILSNLLNDTHDEFGQ